MIVLWGILSPSPVINIIVFIVIIVIINSYLYERVQ